MGSLEWTWSPSEWLPTQGEDIWSLGILILSQWHILIGLFGVYSREVEGTGEGVREFQTFSKIVALWEKQSGSPIGTTPATVIIWNHTEQRFTSCQMEEDHLRWRAVALTWKSFSVWCCLLKLLDGMRHLSLCQPAVTQFGQCWVIETLMNGFAI